MSKQPDDQDLVLLERARTPDEAQVIAGVLKGEGIPAFVGGTSLTDEFAVSRRMLNLLSIDVMVRKLDLENARAALAEARQVDAGELEQQALAAAPLPELATPSHAPSGPQPIGRHWPWLAAAAGIVAVTFLMLWLSALRDVERLSNDVVFRREWSADGLRLFRRDTGALAIEYVSPRTDGSYREVRYFSDTGQLQTVVHELQPNGRGKSVEEHRPDGTRLLWNDQEVDGLYDTLEVRDASGKTLHKLRYAPGAGFVPE